MSNGETAIEQEPAPEPDNNQGDNGGDVHMARMHLVALIGSAAKIGENADPSPSSSPGAEERPELKQERIKREQQYHEFIESLFAKAEKDEKSGEFFVLLSSKEAKEILTMETFKTIPPQPKLRLVDDSENGHDQEIETKEITLIFRNGRMVRLRANFDGQNMSDFTFTERQISIS